MQFSLLYIDKDFARLSCFESLLSHSKILKEADSTLNLVWTDSLGSVLTNNITEEGEEPKTNPNFLLELLNNNSSRITDPLLVCLNVPLAECYNLNFPFSDTKKIKQVLNLELEDILPFELDFTTTFITTQVLRNSSSSGSAVKALLINKPFLQKIINDIQITGSIAPLFLYQPLVTEKLITDLKGSSPETLLALEYDRENSYLFNSSHTKDTIEGRAIVLPTEITPLKEVLQAHINLGNLSEIKNIYLINKTELDLTHAFEFQSKEIVHIEPRSFVTNFSDYQDSSDPLLISSILCAFAIANELVGKDTLDDISLKSLKLFNLREGEFKYRAPFSDFKESLFSEIVPISLTAVFLLLLLILNFSTPIKEISLIERESTKLLKDEAPELSSINGRPLDILSNEIINLENQIGGLTSMRSLSPFDWLYKVSKGLKEDIPVVLESLSITSSGIIFRGTVPNYPTSGRLDSMLKAMMKTNPSLICKGEVNSEQGSSAQKVSITGILELCQ